jgi:hypothetical protein
MKRQANHWKRQVPFYTGRSTLVELEELLARKRQNDAYYRLLLTIFEPAELLQEAK